MRTNELFRGIEFSGGLPDADISGVAFDSRRVTPNGVFVCIRGSASDGHDYAENAAKAGAALIVAEREIDCAHVPAVRVKDTKEALALLSANFYHRPAEKDIKVIGITGTKGKTTTAFMLKAILEAAGHKTGIIGTIGVGYGDKFIKTENTTPSSLEVQAFLRDMADCGYEYCVMEASSIGLKEKRVFGFEFELGVFTNFSEDHIGGVEHRDMLEYMQSKAMLFKMCRVGVINIDDKNHEGITEGHTCELYSYGAREDADLRISDYRLVSRPGFLGIAFELSGRENFTAEVDIPGRFNAYNAAAAALSASLLKVPDSAVKAGLYGVKVKGRVEPVETHGDYVLLIDYAHNAVSMESILTTLREYRPKRLICMFGAGGNRPKVRRYEMGEAAGRLADLSVLTADNSRFENVLDIIEDIKIGMKKTGGNYIEIPNRRDAIRWCLENAKSGDIVVLAGKGHEDYQEENGVKKPFDERVVVAELLEEMKEKENQTKAGD